MTTLDELGLKMEELAKFATHDGINYDEVKADEYYRIQKLYNEERARLNGELNKRTTKTQKVPCKTFVNDYGEATHREITSNTYKRAQARQNKEILSFLK